MYLVEYGSKDAINLQINLSKILTLYLSKDSSLSSHKCNVEAILCTFA